MNNLERELTEMVRTYPLRDILEILGAVLEWENIIIKKEN